MIEPQCRNILLVDFKENGACTKAGQAPQVKVEQFACEPAAALPVSDGHGKDFGLILHKPRQYKSIQRRAAGCAVCDHVAIKKQTLDFLNAQDAAKTAAKKQNEGG